MGTLTPFRITVMAQDGAAAGDSTAGVEQPTQEPLLTGADTALWVGFGAFMSIFLIVLIAIIRARVIKPAERMARATDFFEPAGAQAEITFDDPSEAYAEIKKSRKKGGKKKADKKAKKSGLDTEAPTDVVSEDVPEAQEDAATSEEAADEPAPDSKMAEIAAAIDNAAPEEKEGDESAEEKKAAPFAGLFSRDEAAQEETPLYEHTETAVADVETLDVATAPDDVRIDHLPEIDQNYWDAERQRREAADYARAEEERRMALEAAARARAEAALREEAAAAQRKTDAALDQRMQAMAEMQGKLDAMADRLSRNADGVEARIGASLEKKFEGLSDDLHHRLHAAAAEIDKMQADAAAGVAARGDDGAALMIAGHIEALQKATEAALAGLAERVDALSAAQAADPTRPEELRRLNALLAERAAPAVAGTLQLGDLVRSALPADRYAFDRELSNGAKADCVITRPGAAPFAIDARYPADAFDRYARADDKARDHAATAYRRAILRHMIFVAEKLISPEETADFAILFAPNDTIFNDLHQNFADIVQDAYRARIWIASPTSLMATLHMMNAAAQTDENGQGVADMELRNAVAALTDRIGALEENLARLAATPATAAVVETIHADQQIVESAPPEQAPPDDDASAAANEPPAAPLAETEEAAVEIIGAEPAPADNDADEDAGGAARRPFPLR